MLERIRLWLQEKAFNAVVITNADPHLSESFSEFWHFREYIMDFKSSAGTLVITQSQALFWTDSRYWDSAERHFKNTPFQLQKDGLSTTPSIADFLKKCFEGQALKVAIGGDFISTLEAQKLNQSLNEIGGSLVLTEDIANDLWTENRAPKPSSPIFAHTLSFPSRAIKLQNLRQTLSQNQLDAFCLTRLDDIAWLTNLRGNDVPCSPLFLAWAIITQQDACLFVQPSALPNDIKTTLESEGWHIKDYDTFKDCLPSLIAGQRVGFDPDATNSLLAQQIAKNASSAIPMLSPVTISKSKKNKEEIVAIRNAMLKDGVALCETLAQLDEDFTKQIQHTEQSVAQLFYQYRALNDDFLSLSFETIAASGENAALPHYQPNPAEITPLVNNSFLLVDSGAQYQCGTTDITRTIPIGTVSEKMKADYTRVLQGMIRLARATFPKHTSGSQLDTLAREALWKAGDDYGHGTGHGVGFCLNVHEGPVSISPRAKKDLCCTLDIGNVLSDEPGIYRTNNWGIRIENLLLVQQDCSSDFLNFDILTLCPIDKKAVKKELLDNDDIAWLNQYHQKVNTALHALLSKRAQKWLQEATAEF